MEGNDQIPLVDSLLLQFTTCSTTRCGRREREYCKKKNL